MPCKGLQFVSEAMLKAYKKTSSSETVKARPKRLHETTEHVSDRLKARVTALEFISQYVDLKPNEGGAVGLCPFHDDQHPSFGVNDKENYWHCFAGCGGGQHYRLLVFVAQEEGAGSELYSDGDGLGGNALLSRELKPT